MAVAVKGRSLVLLCFRAYATSEPRLGRKRMINQLPRTEGPPPTMDPADLEGVDAAAGSLIGPLIDPDRLVLRYGSAILMVLLVCGLRLALMPFMGSQAILLPFILCVLGAATLGGFGPAILASVLAPILITLLFPGWLDDLIGLGVARARGAVSRHWHVCGCDHASAAAIRGGAAGRARRHASVTARGKSVASGRISGH